jgi:spore maturation protein CgeB
MRILIVGSDEVWSLERIYKKHLRELGIDVELFPIQSYFYQYYYSHVVNKIFYRLGVSSIIQKLNDQLLQFAVNFKPELIWVFKGMEITPGTINKLKQLGVLVVNFNPDSPFIFSGKGSGNKNVVKSLPLYDLYLSYDRQICNKIRNDFNLPSEILPFGYELPAGLQNEFSETKELVKMCFIGNADKYRIEFLKKVSSKIPIDVFGHGWDQAAVGKNITAAAPVYGNDFWKVLFRYRIQLNLMRPHNPNSHNMRSFEIPGVGGIGLYPDTPDHRDFFGEFGIAHLYTDVDDCISKAEKIFEWSTAQAQEFRLRARALSVQNGYEYSSRTKQFLAIVTKYSQQRRNSKTENKL